MLKPRSLRRQAVPTRAGAGPAGADDQTPRRSARPRALRALPAEVTALVAVAFMVALGFGVVAPAIPLFAREFGVSKLAASAVVSAFALMRLVTAPFAGKLVNFFGERLMLAVGIGIVSVSSFVAGLSDNYWQLLVLRGVGGVGSIMFSVSAASLLIAVTPDHQRGQAQGAFAGAFLLGAIAGPAVGIVASWSLRAPFFVYAGTLVGAGAIAYIALRNSEVAARKGAAQPSMPLRAALGNRAYIAALASEMAETWTVFGARAALVPLYVAEGLHHDHAWTYVAFVIVSVVSGVLLLPVGRFADTRGRRPVLIVGLLLATAAFLLLPILPGYPGLLFAMVIMGVAGAAMSVAPGAILGDVVQGRGGTVVATFQMAGDFGAVIGPLLAGYLADTRGFDTAFVVTALVAVVPIALVLAAPETLRKESSPSAG